MPAFVDLTGRRVGKLTVIERGPNGSHKSILRWRCRCDCGKETLSSGQMLREGRITSCGCERDKVSAERVKDLNRTHGQSKTRLYKVWRSMRQRCYLPSFTGFENYGGRGIKVCDRWESFENWLADMGEPPTRKHTIDRIDPNGNYEPSNCRWATMKEQQNNRTNNLQITAKGETKTLAQWADASGIPSMTIWARVINYGWAPERAVTTPVRPHGRWYRPR